MRAQVTRTYMLAALGFTLFLLIALAVLEIFPISKGNDDLILTQQANFQLARTEFIAKDALILVDVKNPNHAQAIGELQIIIPQYQQVQVGLANGDPVIGLPPNPPDNVRVALAASQGDYLSIDTAAKAILSHTDAPYADPVQVNIIESHERAYITEMSQVDGLIQANAQGKRLQLFLVEMSLKVGIGLLVILKYVLFTKEAMDRMVEQEALCAVSQGKEDR